jgi:hypothetical protein
VPAHLEIVLRQHLDARRRLADRQAEPAASLCLIVQLERVALAGDDDGRVGAFVRIGVARLCASRNGRQQARCRSGSQQVCSNHDITFDRLCA